VTRRAFQLFHLPNATCLKNSAYKCPVPCTLPLQVQPSKQPSPSAEPEQLGHRARRRKNEQPTELGGRKEAEQERNGVRVPQLKQRPRQPQGEEAAAQEGPAQAADREDSGQPRGAGRRQEQAPHRLLRKISKAASNHL
jgi:hypothetical protein